MESSAPTTLPDYLEPGLAAVCIGQNPSPLSTASGVYFANPRNRFWAAARAAGWVPAEVSPGAAAMRHLFRNKRIGFTDVVKRTTPGGAQLRAADYRYWAPILRAKLEANRPGIAWFQGKVAYQQFCRHGLGLTGGDAWGAQPSPWADIELFVTPNPSPANAAFSLDELVQWLHRLDRRLGNPAPSIRR